MKKHLLAIAAILLILSVTACTQYVFDWDSLRPQEITDIEDLVLFMQSDETASARLNLTVDPDDSYFPITIKGTKKISGSLKIEESRFPFSSSTAASTSINSARANSSKNLFEVSDSANLRIDNLTTSVSSAAASNFNSIITVNNGRIEINGFEVSGNTTAIEIGKTATSANISGEVSNLKIRVNEYNLNADKLAIEISTETGADVSIGDKALSDKYAALNITAKTGYKSLNDAVENATSGNEIRLVSDVTTDSRIIIDDKTLTLDLNGHNIESSTIDNLICATNGAFLTINGTGTVHTKGDGVVHITDDAGAIINGGTYISDVGNGINVGTYDPKTNTWASGKVTINAGVTVEAKEYGLGVYHGSVLTVNGGSFTTEDNAVIGTNGTRITGNAGDAVGNNPDYPSYTININGGTFTGNIISFDNEVNAPYIACGIYMANKGAVNITDGTFIINGGVGILLRGGLLDMQGGRIINNHIDGRENGLVGDSHVMLISDEAIVIDQRASVYPAADSIDIINNGGYAVVELDEEGNPTAN